MERLDAAQARDHLELINRILIETQPRLCSGGEHFIVWGFASAAMTLVGHLVSVGRLPASALWSIPALLVAGAIFSIARGRYNQRVLARSSLVQREFFKVLWVTLGMAFIVDVALFHLFPGIAAAAIWSVAEAIVLLYIGMHGNPRAQVAGIFVVFSLIVANFAPSNLAAYALAAGMLVGYAGFGASELLAAHG
jgi:hypothetical protein